MKVSLKFKLSASYALFALLLVGCISVFTNVLMQRQFESYIMRQQDARNEALVLQVAQLYDARAGVFRMDALEAAGMDALERGMILKVVDGSGSLVWDAMKHNGGLCTQMLHSMAERMERRYRNFEGAYEEKTYEIAAGSVSVGYYGPYYYSESDALFIDALNGALAVIGAGALALAVIVGLYMARRLSRPITQAIDMTERIAAGDYDERIDMDADTTEISRLISSVNELSETLSEQDALRRRLTADIAHELCTPLASLQGHVEAFLDGVWAPDRAHLISCHEEILRLTRLVADLQRLANLEDGDAALEWTAVDIKEIAQSAAHSFEPACTQKGVMIEVSGDNANIEGDCDKLRQVLINLIANSLKHTEAGGRIAIAIEGEGDTVRVRVEDDGAGIAAEHLPYIFERFYRADDSRSSESGGAGIGLAIVKAIVAMHGGTIGVQSELGVGTRFWILLPAAQAPSREEDVHEGR